MENIKFASYCFNTEKEMDFREREEKVIKIKTGSFRVFFFSDFFFVCWMWRLTEKKKQDLRERTEIRKEKNLSQI